MQIMLPLDGMEPVQETKLVRDAAEVDPHDYDTVIVAFSGGKDSQACVLHLLDMGIRPELWHHDVDGGPDEPEPELRWDWPVTRSYCRAFAEAFGLPIYFSWRVGGITGELLKENDRTKPVRYEKPDGTIGQGGGITGAISTRRRFPQLGASLLTRWCSSVSKIDVFSVAMAGQERFRGKRVLVVTGERGEESSNRAQYEQFEFHRNHQPGPRAQRHVDHWRPILRWSEAQVWEIIRKHRVAPHPCYLIGLGRASCMTCVFLGKDDLATVNAIAPDRIDTIGRMEKSFGCTLKRDGHPITDHAANGKAFGFDQKAAALAMSETYDAPIIIENWTMPAGAFRHSGGPT